MIKFYIPDGHLEKKALDIFSKAGFKISLRERGYNPTIDDPEILLKRIRPQDFPFVLAFEKGDIAITGFDILNEFRLTYPERAQSVVELKDLGFGWTRLCAAVSAEVLPEVKTISDFRDYSEKLKKEGKKVVGATEYPKLAEDYLKKNGIDAVIRKPAGKTEAWIIPPTPEADMIIDTTETGRTLRENNCRIIDTLLESTSRLVANADSLKDTEKEKKITELVDLFTGVLQGEGKVNVYMNVLEPDNLDAVLGTINGYVKNPTISNLRSGGYDIFIVVDDKELKYLLPELKRNGASSISIVNTRLVIE